MTKSELIAAMAEKTGITKADTGKMLDAFITVVQKELVAGNKVTILGLGILSPIIRAARMGRNPRTGDKVAVPAKNVVTFKLGMDLKKLLNG